MINRFRKFLQGGRLFFHSPFPLFLFFLIHLLFLVSGCGIGGQSSKNAGEKNTPQRSQSGFRIPSENSLANGQRQYHIRGCQKCHGTLGDGNGTKLTRYFRGIPKDKHPRDFKDKNSYKQGFEVENIIYTLRNGVEMPGSMMPKFPYLVDEEIKHIAEYVVFLRTNEIMR